MYIAKMYCHKKLVDIAHYHNFENAVAAISNKRICSDSLSDDVYDKFSKCKIEKIIYGSEGNGVADDFEFQFSDGFCVYVGKVYCEDKEKANA